MENKNEYFNTSDLCLASYLLAKGVLVIDVTKDNPRQAVFIFSNTKDCQKLIAEFSLMKGQVEPLAFFSAQKRLKHLIYL